MNKNATTNSSLKWLYTVSGNKKLYILVLTAVNAVQGGTGVIYAVLLREIVDSAVGHDKEAFLRSLILIFLLLAVQLTLSAIYRWLYEYSRTTIANLFKKRLTETLLRRDYQRVSAIHSGEWLNRLTSDTSVVANNFVDILPGLAGMIVRLISAMVMIIVLEPLFAAIMIPGGVLMIFFTWAFRRVLKRLHKKVQEEDGRLRIFLQEHIGSLLMIKSFGAEARVLEQADEKMQNHQQACMKKNLFSNFSSIGFGAAMNGMYLLGVAWCGYGILNGTITFGTLTAITQLIAQIQAPFASISGYLPRFYAMTASAERLMEAEAFDASDSEAESLDQAVDFYENELHAIGLRDVSFTYYPISESMATLNKNDMPPALQNMSLEIKKGETVAFTGHSGCGKSTALKLLMCVYLPDSGQRYYTDQSGRTSALDSGKRRLFAYVPQGNFLMSGTIRNVVCFADPEAAGDEKRIAEALRIACAEEFVSELDMGIDTLLGERGTGLSEGQMQRLAIARAVFSGSPILLLDEATSALDGRTEKKLLENLQKMTGKTVIIVTHRPAALSICDRILEF